MSRGDPRATASVTAFRLRSSGTRPREVPTVAPSPWRGAWIRRSRSSASRVARRASRSPSGPSHSTSRPMASPSWRAGSAAPRAGVCAQRLTHPTAGQWLQNPLPSGMHATTDSPRYAMPLHLGSARQLVSLACTPQGPPMGLVHQSLGDVPQSGAMRRALLHAPSTTIVAATHPSRLIVCAASDAR